MPIAQNPLIACIVSGGQTGADRAALDWAIQNKVPHGGWCPKGRKAEDGALDARYQLRETDSGDYLKRTKLNVVDSDGTLVVNIGELDGGTLATCKLAQKLKKPLLVLQLDNGNDTENTASLVAWLHQASIVTLNIAGPRESKRRGIYSMAFNFLESVNRSQQYGMGEEKIGSPNPHGPSYVGTFTPGIPYPAAKPKDSKGT